MKRFHGDRRSLAHYESLKRSGHEIFVVSIDSCPATEPVTETVNPHLGPSGKIGGILRSLMPTRFRDKVVRRRLATKAAETASEIFIPAQASALEAAVSAARMSDGVVHRTPGMKTAGDLDLIALAPRNPDLARPAGQETGGFGDFRPRTVDHPIPERFSERSVVLCYRRTDTSPGRYLHAALERSGANLRVEVDAIDLSTVDPATDFVIFVESPYPAIDVTGVTKVPTLFWAHHGEHHLSANLRLADRYRADAVLLAHSWHLAYRFPTPVHRFPFGIVPELFDPSIPITDRQTDIAFVGAHAESASWQYQRRAEVIRSLRSELPERTIRIEEKVSPEEMAEIYANARIVLNEGGARHYPITMRVFEAIGSGAVLLSDVLPGTELLFTPGEHFVAMGDDPTVSAERILGDLEAAQRMSDAALAHARAYHTYDNRVDQLFEIAHHTAKRMIPDDTGLSDLARMVDSDVEVQNIVQRGLPDLATELATRAVWAMEERADGRLRPGSVDAVAVATAGVEGLETLFSAARRYIYATTPVAGLGELVRMRHPNAVFEQRGDLLRVDLMTAAFRVATRAPQNP